MEESLTFKACSCLGQKASFHPALLTFLPFPHSGGQKMCHKYPLPIRAAKLALGHIGIAVPGSDFLTQLRFPCQTFPGTSDSFSRVQQWCKLAPHLFTVGKHNCQRTEHWERQEKNRKRGKNGNKSHVGHLWLLEKKCHSNKRKSRCAAFAW